MQNFFVGNAKKINNIFLVNSNKISNGPYLNEKRCWAKQIFVDSTNYFSGVHLTIISFFIHSFTKPLFKNNGYLYVKGFCGLIIKIRKTKHKKASSTKKNEILMFL